MTDTFSFGPSNATGRLRTIQGIFLPFVDAISGTRNAHYNRGTPDKLYDYLYTGDRNISIGDFAVVHNGTHFGIVEIKRILTGISNKVQKNVITVITKEDFQKYLEANQGIVRHREVFDQLDGMLAQESQMDKYRKLAEHNPQAKALLESLQIWTGPVIESQQGSSNRVQASEAERDSKVSGSVNRPSTRTDFHGGDIPNPCNETALTPEFNVADMPKAGESYWAGQTGEGGFGEIHLDPVDEQ